ncbi:trichohyalin-like [Microplitis mediator]|uniref:trichohyalin-like n=1 Tax=Microplitis mediator TaxID=375433 RepID=UPI00255567A4|nr:trichohyalin-like [Microplitis mediator]
MKKQPVTGSQTWVWSLRKDALLKELEKYPVNIEPQATLSELRFLLRTELNKAKAANAGRAGRYDKLLVDLDRSEAELDNLDNSDDGATIEDPENDDEHPSDEDRGSVDQSPETRNARHRQTREEQIRVEIEREERERFEREERERIEAEERERMENERRQQEERDRRAREAREQAEREQAERERAERAAREAAERDDQEIRERLRQEIRAQLLREREEQRARDAGREEREARVRRENEQREREEQELRARLREEIREQILREENERRERENRNRRTGHESMEVAEPRAGSSRQGTPLPSRARQSLLVDDSVELRKRDLVRKWGVVFNGERDVQEFLERLEELAESYGYEMDHLVPCIPILLREKALLWYRNNKRDWVSWEDFVSDLKAFYLPPGLELELEEQIRNRVQRSTETAAEYATKLQTLMRRHGQMSTTARLTRLYHNLRPEYRRYIKRTEFTTVPELLRLAGEYEQLVAQERAPPAKETKQPPRKPVKTATQAPLEIFEYNWRECCWRCRQRGHTKPECTNQWVKFCMRCGKMGTFSRDCPCPRQGNAERTGTRSQTRSVIPPGAQNQTSNAPRSPEPKAGNSSQQP